MKTFKKAVSVLLALSVMFCFASCDGKKAEKQSLFAQLDAIKATEVGTAGSSLKVVKPTLDLVSWAKSTKLDSEQITEFTKEYISNLSSDEKELFALQLESVNYTFESLAGSGGEDILDASGNSDFDLTGISTVFPIVTAIYSALG